LEPDREAARELKVPPGDIKPIRDLGVTAVLVAPARGLFRGASALVPLRDSVDSHDILRSPVALHVGYQGVPGDYPGTLLGVVTSVNFPQPTQTTGWSYRLSQRRALNDSAASAREVQKLLEGNAAALNKAGVHFALASGGSRDFVANVRKAVAAGLPANVALE